MNGYRMDKSFINVSFRIILIHIIQLAIGLPLISLTKQDPKLKYFFLHTCNKVLRCVYKLCLYCLDLTQKVSLVAISLWSMDLVGPMISGSVRTVAQKLPGSGKQIFHGFFLSRL